MFMFSRRFLQAASLAALAPMALSSCLSLIGIKAEPKVELDSVQLRSVDGDAATVEVALAIENPNDSAIEVDSVEYALEIDGKPVGNGRIENKSKVPARGKATVGVPVRVKYSDLFASVLAFLQPGQRRYKVSGVARFGIFRVPFEKTGELKPNK